MKLLTACAALFLGAYALHAQVVLDLTFTGPNTIVVTATGKSPVTSDSGHSYIDGIDLEGLFVPSAGVTDSPTVVLSSLTTGDASTGPVYNDVLSDSLSEPNADLNIYYSDLLDEDNATPPPQTFTFGLPAFAVGTSMTIDFTGLVFSGIDYGVVVAGFSGNNGLEPIGPLIGADNEAPISTSTVPIGVYHVTNAAPEPSTYALMLGSLAVLGLLVRRKQASNR